ncbi:cobalt-precorrin-6A reductase [Saccharopolyspora phatthalungensis]|uniref:Precorrin-6A/cobalt-precorrin-6A reductase n=1 Tax=Saccharopolyspora phatthalungensis TaxID=664693 RepID=A0A840Q7A7_9PSEU|nr:cobalt-precorrin-6A reductase [Saccharopolyspora phatthalungensis]MBB5155601.1 precorrin-6A/cobalt-precorrin-6A reductase [Saccharopolyspora phatthalungensis]
MTRVLILGGTSEGRKLAERLDEQADLHVTSSLAGRVRKPQLPPGEVRVGGFGGPDGLADWLRRERVGAVVDATHPFARTITDNAVAAAEQAGCPLLVLRRPAWQPGIGDDWRSVPSLAEAAALLPELGERIFLTTGRQGLAHFAALDLRFLVRTVDPPEPPLPRRTEVLLARGPFTVHDELALLREHDIDVVVTKNSGGAMTSAKLTAARELRLPVVMVQRPPQPPAPSAETVADAIAWLDSVLCRGNHAG